MTDTATTKGAREHARAQAESAAARVLAKPIIPACDAVDLPDGIDAATLVWAETLGAGGYAARTLERGTRLRIDNPSGDACVGLLVYNADNFGERLNVADTVKVQWQAYLGEGSLLLSDMGRVLLSIVLDTSGQHDVLCGATSPWSNQAKYGEGDNHGPFPSARERFALALAKFGLGKRDICANINLFKRVEVDSTGALQFIASDNAPASFVEFRAEMRVLVILANTPHVLDPRPEYVAPAVRILASTGEVTGAECPIRNATPERVRAFENVEDYFGR